MAGNAWEWMQDWYDPKYYELSVKTCKKGNPLGARAPFIPYGREKIIKEVSFSCHTDYCASYRISSRMGNTLDSSQEHLGFRMVVIRSMLTSH